MIVKLAISAEDVKNRRDWRRGQAMLLRDSKHRARAMARNSVEGAVAADLVAHRYNYNYNPHNTISRIPESFKSPKEVVKEIKNAVEQPKTVEKKIEKAKGFFKKHKKALIAAGLGTAVIGGLYSYENSKS